MPSVSRPGICRARAPVAKITCADCIIWLSVFWLSLPDISTTQFAPDLPPSLALPSMTVTLFFFSKCATPEERRAATLRERLTTFSRLTFTSPVTSIPKSDICARLWRISAARSRALVGIQPQFRQIPPRCSRSITATDFPSWLARIAAT